jgi:hypothetical protein
MTDEEKLDLIKTVLEETGENRALTDAQLQAYLAQASGDAMGVIYLGALAKARVDAATLPDGTSVPSAREYWLGIASAFRPNRGGVIPRV